jgi:hypothetical protein
LGQLMIIAECTAEILKAPERDTPFNRVMKVWSKWIKLKDRDEPGGWAHPQDSKEIMQTGEAVDSMLKSLPRVNRWAVDKAHGVCRVWLFPDRSFPDAMEEAENILTPKMRAHRDTMRFFYQ